MVLFCTMRRIIRVSKSEVTNISLFQCWNNVAIRKVLQLALPGVYPTHPDKSGIAEQVLSDI